MNNWIRENLKHLKKLIDFFIEFVWERILCIIPVLALILLFTFLFFKYSTIINPNEIESQQILVFGISLDNLGTWLTAVGLIVAAFWSLIQYEKGKVAKRQEKASEIAKSFSNRLTTKCSIIYQVIRLSKIYPLLKLNQKEYDHFKTFTTNEIRNIYSDDNFIEKYVNTRKESDLDQLYYRVLDSRISFNTLEGLTKSNKTYSEEEAQKLFILNNADLPFKFKALISDTLNELEYLCMSLSSQAAGSKYVYQSLHQAFLRTIRLLSVEIAITNKNSSTDKYYTSIISVYNEWTFLHKQYQLKEKKQLEKMNKLISPKIKTV